MSKATKPSTSRRAVIFGATVSVAAAPSLAHAVSQVEAADTAIFTLVEEVLGLECHLRSLMQIEDETGYEDDAFLEVVTQVDVLRERLVAMTATTIEGLVAKARVAVCFAHDDCNDYGWTMATAINLLRFSPDSRDRAALAPYDRGEVVEKEIFLSILAVHLPNAWKVACNATG